MNLGFCSAFWFLIKLPMKQQLEHNNQTLPQPHLYCSVTLIALVKLPPSKKAVGHKLLWVSMCANQTCAKYYRLRHIQIRSWVFHEFFAKYSILTTLSLCKCNLQVCKEHQLQLSYNVILYLPLVVYVVHSSEWLFYFSLCWFVKNIPSPPLSNHDTPFWTKYSVCLWV